MTMPGDPHHEIRIGLEHSKQCRVCNNAGRVAIAGSVEKREMPRTRIVQSGIDARGNRDMRSNNHELITRLTGIKLVFEPVEPGLVKRAQSIVRVIRSLGSVIQHDYLYRYIRLWQE